MELKALLPVAHSPLSVVSCQLPSPVTICHAATNQMQFVPPADPNGNQARLIKVKIAFRFWPKINVAAYHILHIFFSLASFPSFLTFLHFFSYFLTDSRRFVSWHVEVNFKLYTSASVLRFSLDWSRPVVEGGVGEGREEGKKDKEWMPRSSACFPCPALVALCKYWNRFSFHKLLHRIVALSVWPSGQGQVLLRLQSVWSDGIVVLAGWLAPVGLVASPSLLCFMFVPCCCWCCCCWRWLWLRLFMQVDYGVWFWL